MNHPKPITIIDLAFKGACIRIAELQREVQLIESFGNKAMINESFYHPEDLIRNEELFNVVEMKNDINDLIKLSAELKTAREKYFDKQYEGAIKEMFKKI